MDKVTTVTSFKIDALTLSGKVRRSLSSNVGASPFWTGFDARVPFRLADAGQIMRRLSRRPETAKGCITTGITERPASARLHTTSCTLFLSWRMLLSVPGRTC